MADEQQRMELVMPKGLPALPRKAARQVTAGVFFVPRHQYAAAGYTRALRAGFDPLKPP